MKNKYLVLILDNDGRIDSKEYSSLSHAIEAFSKIVMLTLDDEYGRVVRLVHKHHDKVETMTFDSKLDK